MEQSSITVDEAIANLDVALLQLGGSEQATSATKYKRESDGAAAQTREGTEKASVMREYAPLGLETAFQELHSVLYPCLCHGDSTMASAILMGPRGSGKSMLLEQCLSACLWQQPDTKFRRVQLNGIIVRGDDVNQVIVEIIRQLSSLARDESRRGVGRVCNGYGGTTADDGDGDGDDGEQPEHMDIVDGVMSTIKSDTQQSWQGKGRPAKKRARHEKDEDYILRLRKSSFASNLALLESTFELAEADGIPVLIILDELDMFADYDQRQLLLYHLLDRVATPGSNLCFVGLTSNFATLSVWEKRIQSRAEGTSKVIYIRPPKTYEDMVKLLSRKLDGCFLQDFVLRLLQANGPASKDRGKDEDKADDGNDSSKGSKGGSGTSNDGDDEENDEESMLRQVRACMQLEFALGKDVRWFLRVLTTAVSLYRFDCVMETAGAPLPPVKVEYWRDALVTAGASLQSRSSKIPIVNGKAVVPRMQALLDMSASEAAVLLCARRILARDSHRDDIMLPLSIQRILKEYERYRGSKMPLESSINQLLERGLLMPSSDHNGGGSLQYTGSRLYKTLDRASLHRLPLHITIDAERELMYLLNNNRLDVPTGLRDWGKRIN